MADADFLLTLDLAFLILTLGDFCLRGLTLGRQKLKAGLLSGEPTGNQPCTTTLRCSPGSQSWCSKIQILQTTTKSHPIVHRVGFKHPSAFRGL